MKLPKLDNLGSREKIMLGAAAVALAGMMLSLLALPFISGVEEIDRECVIRQKQVARSRSLIGSEEAVTADFMQIESVLGTSLSDSESISEMKEDIEDMARSAGLTFDPPSHNEPVADSALPWREYFVELARCEGSMKSLLAFIDALEGAPVVYRIEKMSVSPAKSGTGVSAAIVMSRIMLPPEEMPEEDSGES
jgi:hypothetical protein